MLYTILYMICGIVVVVGIGVWFCFFSSYTTFTVNDLIEDMAPGHNARMARYYHEQEEERVREKKKQHLEQELQDAEWILEYEKRLAKLQKKTTKQRSKIQQVGSSTARLQKLEHYLEDLRRNASLD